MAFRQLFGHTSRPAVGSCGGDFLAKDRSFGAPGDYALRLGNWITGPSSSKQIRAVPCDPGEMGPTSIGFGAPARLAAPAPGTVGLALSAAGARGLKLTKPDGQESRWLKRLRRLVQGEKRTQVGTISPPTITVRNLSTTAR